MGHGPVAEGERGPRWEEEEIRPGPLVTYKNVTVCVWAEITKPAQVNQRMSLYVIQAREEHSTSSGEERRTSNQSIKAALCLWLWGTPWPWRRRFRSLKIGRTLTWSPRHQQDVQGFTADSFLSLSFYIFFFLFKLRSSLEEWVKATGAVWHGQRLKATSRMDYLDPVCQNFGFTFSLEKKPKLSQTFF